MPAVVCACRLDAEQLERVSALLVAQERRHYEQNRLLRAPRTQEQARQQLIQQQEDGAGQPFIALDAQQEICGYAYAYVWELSERSLLHAFLTRRNGCVSTLILPAETHSQAEEVRSALLNALSDYWRVQHTTGELVRWPHADQGLSPLLHAQSFALDSVCAFLALADFP